MRLIGATDSHVGNVREANQDRVFFGGLVAALADGMGGHQGGERAAELAIAEFEIAGQKLSESELVEVIMEANRQVHGHAADNGLPGMGTTLVALTLHDDETITVANVGDSRAYWLRGDYMGQVTEDHSFVEDLVRQGRLKPEEAAIHPQRNILTRAVGIGAEVEVDRFPIPEPQVGDRFLLCSDGLFNELAEEEILEILLDAGDPASTAKALIEAALETPCRDNVTVAVVDLVEDDDPSLGEQSSRLTTTKPITSPVPVVTKSRLHEPGSSPSGDEESDNPSGRTGTLVLDEPDGELEDPEQFLDTTELAVVEVPDIRGPASVAEPRSRLMMSVGVLGLLALLIGGGLFLARSMARSGFHIEQEPGQLVAFEGRRGGFLFFDPVRLDDTEILVGPLTDSQIEQVEQEFASRAEVDAFLSEIATAQTGVLGEGEEGDGAATGPAASSESENEDSGTDQGIQPQDQQPQDQQPQDQESDDQEPESPRPPDQSGNSQPEDQQSDG